MPTRSDPRVSARNCAVLAHSCVQNPAGSAQNSRSRGNAFVCGGPGKSRVRTQPIRRWLGSGIVRIVVIGGSGHVGSFLVPRLVRAGHEVVNLTRGARAPYVDDDAWSEVEQIQVDRTAEDATGTFGQRVATLEADVVVDMICFTPESAAALVEALRGHSGHLVHCGTIWRYGLSLKQPMREDDTSPPFGEYGTQKAAIAELLAAETRSGGLVTTVLQPGHISGPGWPPIGPLGNLDPDIWYALSAGQEIAVPGLGAELMHHVHADDVAQAFQLAIEHRDAAAGSRSMWWRRRR